MIGIPLARGRFSLHKGVAAGAGVAGCVGVVRVRLGYYQRVWGNV